MSCILFDYRNKINVSIHFSWISSIAMAVIRIISLVLIMIRYFAYLNVNNSLASYELIYLTFYGFLITILYYLCVVAHLVISKIYFLKKKQTRIIFLEDCINVLYEIALAIEMTLTLLFWVLLSEGGQDLGGFDNLGIHLMPFLLLFIDFIFNSYQFPLRHFIFTTIAAGIYIVINQVHACSVWPVYDIYECGNIWIPLVAFILLAATHMMGYLVWKYLRGGKITQNLDESQSGSLLENQ